ncbi:MAG: hypothetical protein ACOYNY_43100 [Caldilineaceae bacterium]
MNTHRTASAPPSVNGQPIFFIDKRNQNFFHDRTCKLYSPAEQIQNAIVFFTVVNLILLIILVINSWRWWQFTMNGVITEAKVIERELDNSGDSTSYYLTYEYSARLPDQSRQSFTSRDSVSSRTYYQHELGTYILIRYLKHDPANATSKWHPGWIEELITGYGVALLLLWLGCFYLPKYYRNRIHTILTQGQVLPGHVLTSTGEDDDGSYKFTVTYEFTAPTTGHVRKGDFAETRNDLKQTALPVPGTSVAVMYLTEYDFFLL